MERPTSHVTAIGSPNGRVWTVTPGVDGDKRWRGGMGSR